jgi:hypothetical protein
MTREQLPRNEHYEYGVAAAEMLQQNIRMHPEWFKPDVHQTAPQMAMEVLQHTRASATDVNQPTQELANLPDGFLDFLEGFLSRWD